jgi:putative SOS response-associated peptidase YedK
MAGIWSSTRHAAPTVAILTTAPNALVAGIHNRMPVILPLGVLDDWLDPATPPADLAPMLLSTPEETLRMWPVSTAVNRVQVDGPELLRPIELAPTLGLA